MNNKFNNRIYNISVIQNISYVVLQATKQLLKVINENVLILYGCGVFSA